MKYFVNVLVDVLGAVYQAAGASLLIAVLIMCVYMLGRKQGVGSGSLKKAAGFADTFSLCFIPVCCFFVRYSVGASGEIRWKT